MKMLALAFVALMAACSCASIPSHESLRGLSLYLVTAKLSGMGICSGAPVAADAFDTAAHCLAGGIAIQVNGHPVGVKSVTQLSPDRVTVTLDKPLFTRWAKRGAPPKQGDRVRWWGNPQGVADVYRVGAVAHIHDGLIAVDAMVCKGDSGSGMFNDAGELVGVVSMRLPEQSECQFMVGQR